MSEPASTITISFRLNGSPLTVSVDPTERLLDTLRARLGFTGTKEGCGEGECGACTVLVDDLPTNSCLVPTYQVRNRDVVSVEAVSAEEVTPLLESGGTQCGACTPGVVMTARWIAADPDVLALDSARALMAGNLCRCTGYDGILDGVERMLRRTESA